MARILFSYGTQEQYTNTKVKNDNQLYFITDTKRIYKGNELIADSKENQIEFTSSVPAVETAVSDKIYVVNTNGSVGIYIKDSTGAIVQVGGGTVGEGAITTLDAFANDLLLKSTDGKDNDKLATVGAINEAVTTALADYNGALVSVEANRSQDNSGTVLTFTAKNGDVKNVTIADLFLSSASYDSTTHLLSFTVTGSKTPVTVNLEELIPQAVNASQVALARNITATVDVGNIKKGQKIDITSIKDIQSLFENILSQDSNPTTTQPSASITLTGAGAKEVGSEFTPNYTAKLNAGSYSNNAEGTQPTGIKAKTYAITDSDAHSATTATGSFTKFTVQDDTNYYVSATITYDAGNVPTTFLGKAYEAGQIKAGSKSATSTHVTGYRNGFYGSLTSKTGEINSALVRGLTKTNKKVSKGQKYTVSVPAGTMRVVIAYETTIGTIASITSDEQFGSEIKDSFTLTVVSVNDASGANAKDYNVYVKDLASAQSSATKYQVTI